MKRIGNLFEEIVDMDNLRLAFWKASRGKRMRPDQQDFQRNLDARLSRLRRGLIDGDYPVGDFKRFTIYDPKEREICAASFGERVLHHALMNVCEPYFDKWLVDDTYACRKGKGQVSAVRRAEQFARRCGWYMKCDFRKYFDSVPHDGLKAVLRRRFKDPFLLGWFFRIIDSYEKTPGRGLPIGSLTSQHFANLYLDRLDRFVQSAGFRYVRYMDDSVAWADGKAALLGFRPVLESFARETLGLEFKQEPFVNRTRLGMDFLGTRVYPGAVRISRAGRVRYRRKLAACAKAFSRGGMDEREYQARVTALTAFTEISGERGWRRRALAACEEHRATTVFCAAAAGTTTRGTAVPPTATGTIPATATGTTASASPAPQHRRAGRAVPADCLFPPRGGTNETRRSGASSDVESYGAPPFHPGGGDRTP